MNNEQELKAHLQDRNKARIYAAKKNRHNVLVANEHKKKEDEHKIKAGLMLKYIDKFGSDAVVVCQNCDGQNIGTNTYTYEDFCKDCKTANDCFDYVDDEHKKKEDEMVKNWKDEIAINKGGQ